MFHFVLAVNPATNGNPAKRQTGKDVSGTQNAFWNFRPQWPVKAHRKKDRFRDGDPSKTILASTRFLWAATVDTECFSSANRATAFLLHVFDSGFHRQLTSSDRNFRRLSAIIAQNFTGEFGQNP